MIHQNRGENAPWGLRIKRARDDFVSRLFNPPQASLLLRDKDDCSPNLPSATSEECNDNDCNYLSSNHHIAIGAHERQVFEKLLWGLVSSTIFVRC